LFASERRIENAANNIANAQSSNFRAQDVVQSTDASGGVSTRVVERNPATVPTVDRDGNVAERPNVNLEQEVIQADIATYSAQANLKVLQTQDRLDKYLLDIQA
jgi:flagellar basal body rod protein FlgC